MLPRGVVSLTPIAQATGLPLTTVQSVMARLTALGLVAVSQKKSRHLYEALDPVVLKRILERQAEEVTGVIPELRKLMQEEAGSPNLRVYYRERMADIFHQALGAQGKMVLEIVSARDIQDVLGEKFHFTWRRVQSGVRLRSLRVERREIKKYAPEIDARELREAKFLPRELTFRASIMIWDDTVAFFTPKDEGLAWTVRSSALAETLRQLFDLLWSVSRKMTVS
jgi:sugar-specific transcriptional regulator TrmB